MGLNEESISEVICQFDKYEAPVICALLKKYDGNKAKVAAKMGISRPSLYKKIKKYNIT
jgi:transcriptional regulator with PAS, ATPase and Fis domain